MGTSTTLFPQTPDNLVRDQAGNAYKMFTGYKEIAVGSGETSVRVFPQADQPSQLGRYFNPQTDLFFCYNADFKWDASELVPVVTTGSDLGSNDNALWARECSNTVLQGSIRVAYMVLMRQ